LTTATVLTLPRDQFFDSRGQPVASGGQYQWVVVVVDSAGAELSPRTTPPNMVYWTANLPTRLPMVMPAPTSPCSSGWFWDPYLQQCRLNQPERLAPTTPIS
jgi:hypothetical protein